MGKSADSFNILGGLAQFASAITSEKEFKSDYVAAGLDLVEGGAKVTAGAAGLAEKTGPKDAAKGNKQISDASGAIGDVAGGLKSTLDAFLKAFDLYKEWSKKSSSEKAKQGVGAIQDALKAAQSGVKAAKGFTDAWGGAGPAGPPRSSGTASRWRPRGRWTRG